MIMIKSAMILKTMIIITILVIIRINIIENDQTNNGSGSWRLLAVVGNRCYLHTAFWGLRLVRWDFVSDAYTKNTNGITYKHIYIYTCIHTHTHDIINNHDKINIIPMVIITMIIIVAVVGNCHYSLLLVSIFQGFV